VRNRWLWIHIESESWGEKEEERSILVDVTFQCMVLLVCFIDYNSWPIGVNLNKSDLHDDHKEHVVVDI